MRHMNVTQGREFTVTVSRVPTSEMVYAIRTTDNQPPQLYVVMADVIEGYDESARVLKPGTELLVTVDAMEPSIVVRAKIFRLGSARAVSIKPERPLAAPSRR